MQKLIISSLIFFTVAACSSPYLKNRKRDFADIATLELQTKSYGTSFRVGPIQAGLSYKSHAGKSYGLRGGHLGKHNTAEFTILIFGSDYFTAGPMKNLQNGGIPEEDKSSQTILPGTTSSEDVEELEELTAQTEGAANISILRDRKKDYRARSPFGTTVPLAKKRRIFRKKDGFAPGYYFTQIDFTLGMYFGIRIGINPGELLDFILGLAKLDLYDDDEPFEDPRLRELKKSPIWKSMDKKTQEKMLKELQNYR